MKGKMRIIPVGLLISLVGCASTKQVTTTYWTEKAGVASIHHVVGKSDSIEKLTQKPLTSDEAEAANLPKGKYFKVIDSHADAPVKPSQTPKKDTKKDSDSTKLAEVKSEIHDLRTQVSRLKDQLATQSPAPSPDTQAVAQETQQEAAQPRLSQ